MCAAICSRNAITVKEDDYGFLRPTINEELCVDCGACRRICPELNRVEMCFPSSCFAAAISETSFSHVYASGGVASALCRYFLQIGGIVVASCGNDIRNVCHRIIRTPDNLCWIYGSRYVQSRISPKLLEEIKIELNKGTEVLFIGTGCQTAGVKNLFSKKYSNLTLVDLVCHGVPSQRMLNDNIDYYTKLYPGFEPSSVHFREKENGIISYGWYAKINADRPKSIAVPWKKDPYMAAFLDHISLRPCCSDCRYAFSARATDITLCDFWGLGKDSRLRNRNGVSAVLINTPKGEALFKNLSDLDVEQREVGEAIRGVGRLQVPSPYNPMTNRFRLIFKENGFHKAVSETTFAKFKREQIKSNPLMAFCVSLFRRIMKR